MKKNILIGLGTAAFALTLGTIQASGQPSVLFDFSYNAIDASQGWANAGYSSTPQASVVSIGGQNYISVNKIGYQAANVSSSSQIGGGTYSQDNYLSPALNAQFNAAMYAAMNNPGSYYLSYDYYLDTSSWITPGSYLQLSSYVNPESGYSGQSGTPSAYEPSFNGTQVTSGGVFSGSVTVPFTAYGTDPNAASEVGFRLGLIINGDGTGVTVDYSNIKVYGVPEPATLALCGMGLLGSLLALRRRLS